MNGPAEPTPHVGEREFELRDAIRIIRRRYWAGLITVAVCLAVGILITMRTPRIYRATAKILIDQAPPEVLAGVREVYSLGAQTFWTDHEYMQTQFDVIKSRPVAQK